MKLINLVGNTPLVKLQCNGVINNKNIEIWAKMEGKNPSSSVKDRAAYAMINTALKNGTINLKTKLVEATSGNTGIALAMICAYYGIDITLIMPESATEERKKIMRAYGANLILTPAEKTIEYSRTFAQAMVDEENYYMLNQFSNPANPNMHYQTTGPEIWKATQGNITHFVSSMGTTGTIMGVSRYLKAQKNTVQIIGTQPTEGSRIPGIRRWSPDFLPQIYEPHRIDNIIDVSTDEAIENARWLAKHEAMFVGMSSGGAFTVAKRVAQQINKGVIVFIACDLGDRYLSSNLFE